MHDRILDGFLLRPEERYRALFENALDGIFQGKLEGRFILANPACARILGYASPEELTAPDGEFEGLFFVDRARFREFQRLLQEQGVVEKFEARIFRRDRRKIWISLNARAIRNPGRVSLLYEGRMEDITERKCSEERIHNLTFQDKLTGLYNRAFFEEEVKRLDTARQLPVSVVMGDVNGLKLVNDAFGHQEGDELLIQIASILRKSCRLEDVIARLGGDEFIIFLPRTGAPAAAEIIRRIKCLAGRKRFRRLKLSIALGAATKEKPCQDIRKSLRGAEERMYEDKLLESKNVRLSFFSSLKKALFEKSCETEKHNRRVETMACKVGVLLGFPGEKLQQLAHLADWHDIGMVAIPEKIHRMAEPSAEERQQVRKHPEIGYRIAESSAGLVPVAEAILTHHERWDGTGYPLRLKGKDIPVVSRILSIAHAFDVMTHRSPGKETMDGQTALQRIRREAGTRFDPELVHLFSAILSEPGEFEEGLD